ncbi:hypothetical protein [Nonomuraea sp. NPDC049400]|uniref:hypothetical protein n=1 Tax=Nonomuraea sp. NPDC049400 TaxID=3364352 RepID=UPI0037953958
MTRHRRAGPRRAQPLEVEADLTSSTPHAHDHVDTVHAELVRRHDGDGTAAVLALARYANVAVNYLDRQLFDSRLKEFHGRSAPLTDDEWHDLIAWRLDGYDEHVSEHTCWQGQIERAYMDEVLTKSGILADEENGGDQQDARAGDREARSADDVDPLNLSGTLAAAASAAAVLAAAREVVDKAKSGGTDE